MADEEIENAIRQNAQGPASAEADGVKATQHTLADQIAADKHVGAKAAGRTARKSPPAPSADTPPKPPAPTRAACWSGKENRARISELIGGTPKSALAVTHIFPDRRFGK